MLVLGIQNARPVITSDGQTALLPAAVAFGLHVLVCLQLSC